MANKVEIVYNADGSRAIRVHKELTASARARGQAEQDAAKVAAIAARLTGEAVSASAVLATEARRKEQSAMKDYLGLQAAVKKGSIDEATGVSLLAGAYQRLTKAKEAAAAASAKAGARSDVRDLAVLRESFGIVGLKEVIPETLEGVAAIAAVAELASKMKEAVSASLEFGEAIQRASEKTGLAVGTLSTLHYAAAITGGDFDGMTSAVAKMDKTIGAASEGNKTAQGFLRGLGLNARDLAGRSDGAEIAFRKFASTLASTENPIRRVELATGLLGKAGAEMIPTLIMLGNNWDLLTEKSTAAGTQLNATTLAQLVATNQRFEDLRMKVLGASVAFTGGLTPALTGVLSVISGGKGSMDALADFGMIAGRGFAFAAMTAYSFAAGLAKIVEAEAGFKLTAEGRHASELADEFDAKAKAMAAIAFSTKPLPLPKPIVTAALPGSGSEPFGGTGGDPNAGAEAKKAGEAQLKAFEAEERTRQMLFGMSNKQEFDFWGEKLQIVKGQGKAYLDEYDAILAKQEQLGAESARAAHEGLVRILKGVKADSAYTVSTKGVDEVREESRRNYAKVAEDRAATAEEISLAGSRMKAELAEAAVRERMGKSLDEHGAAMMMASIHAQEYKDQLEALTAQQTRMVDLTNGFKGQTGLLTPEQVEQTKQLLDVQRKIDSLNKARNVQVQQDAFSVKDADQSAAHGATAALDGLTLSATNFSKVTEEFLTGGITRINQSLVGLFTKRPGQRTDFGAAGHDIFTSATGALLKGAEGKVGEFFGFGGGGLGSSAAHAMFVQIVSGGAAVGKAVASVGSSVLHAFHIPSFDVGTNSVPRDMLAMVHQGEAIIPKAFNDGGGGKGATVNHYYDCRGATDPAAIESAIRRAAPAIATTGAQLAMKAIMRDNGSRPSSARRF